MEMVKGVFSFLSKKQVYGLAIILFLGIISYYFGQFLIQKVINSGKNDYEKKKRKTIVNLISNILKYVIYILLVLAILNLYGVDTKALIASLGIVGAVLGLALQDTIKDFISGITIIMDNFFVVGDIVTYNGFTGEILELGLKTTKIKNFNGEVLVISNRNIDQVINISQELAKIFIDIPTAYEEKISKVEKTITKILEEIKKIPDVKKEPEYLGVSELSDSSVKYTICFYCTQEKQWQVRRDALKIIKDIYDKDKIKIPYTQIEVHHEQRV